MNEVINVLDKGYVRYDKHMGDDLDVVNSAKVSYAKSSETFAEREARLLAFLMREEHTSVLRHSAITYEVYAPLMVARQWWKYVVSSAHTTDQNGWNESSRRYITEEPAFYIPAIDEWRSKPLNSKQGSGAVLPHYNPKTGDLPEGMDEMGGWDNINFGNHWTNTLEKFVRVSERLYEDALEAGVAAEQARLFLPAYGMYVRWRWTTSLAGVLHFLHQRLEHDAQKEIQDYARAVRDLTEPLFPATFSVMFPKEEDEQG